MFKQSACNLLTVQRDQVEEWLKSFDTVITDCDGVLWLHGHTIVGSVPTINTLQNIGKKLFFCTNNSTKTRYELHKQAIEMGFLIQETNIISSAHSTAAYLKDRCFKKDVYVVGTEGITTELSNVGINHTPVGPDIMEEPLGTYLEQFTKCPNIGAVIVGFDHHFSFPKMLKAASYLSDPDVLFVATNTDYRFPARNKIIPGTGCIVHAIEMCSNRKPILIGKPSASICDWLIADNLIVPERTLMIGDNCATDILLGYNCNFQTLLVGTGVNTHAEVLGYLKSNDEELKKRVPDVYLPTLGDLLQFL